MRTYEDLFASNLMLDISYIPDKQVTSRELCILFVMELCDEIDMVRHGEPQVEHFGDGHLAGWTVSQLIETSHIVAHFMDPQADLRYGGLHLDVSSCGTYDPADVVAYVRRRWPSCQVRARHMQRYQPRIHAAMTPYCKVAGEYDRFHGSALDRYEDSRVCTALKQAPATRILDLGCGNGAGLRMALRAGGCPETYVGIDLSRRMLDHFWFDLAGQRIGMAGGRYFQDRGITIDLKEQPLETDNLDSLQGINLVLGLWSLHYLNIREFSALMGRVRSVCAVGARLVVTLYGPEYQGHPDDVCGGEGPRIKLLRDHQIGGVLQDQGFALYNTSGITGPITNALPSGFPEATYEVVDWVDRFMVSDPYSKKFVFTMLEAQAI